MKPILLGEPTELLLVNSANRSCCLRMTKIELDPDRKDISVQDFTEAFAAQTKLVREISIFAAAGALIAATGTFAFSSLGAPRASASTECAARHGGIGKRHRERRGS